MRHRQLLLFCITITAGCCLKAQTVFISSKGKKYHLENCQGLGPDKKALAVKEAEKNGFKPHRGCKIKKKLKQQEAAKREK